MLFYERSKFGRARGGFDNDAPEFLLNAGSLRIKNGGKAEDFARQVAGIFISRNSKGKRPPLKFKKSRMREINGPKFDGYSDVARWGTFAGFRTIMHFIHWAASSEEMRSVL